MISIALFAYNIFYNVIDVKINAYQKILDKIPIIVVTDNDSLLYKVSSELDTLNFIDKIYFIMPDTLRKNLIKKYKLETANRYLKNSYLPKLMKIYVKNGKFNSENKTKIASVLKKYKNHFTIKYNDEQNRISKEFFQ